jgi:CBS-domain-containing membrane protein
MKTLESKLEKLLVTESVTVKEALRQLEAGSKKILFVVDANRLLKGTLTDTGERRFKSRYFSRLQLETQVHHKSFYW